MSWIRVRKRRSASILLARFVTNHLGLLYESQLYRLVSNLIAHGVQYPPSSGNVVIELTRRDRLAVITVKDTGIGIASGEQTRIFERFYPGDSDRNRQAGGTALGLAIVQAIGQKHQGQRVVIIVELIVLLPVLMGYRSLETPMHPQLPG